MMYPRYFNKEKAQDSIRSMRIEWIQIALKNYRAGGQPDKCHPGVIEAYREELQRRTGLSLGELKRLGY